MLRSGHANFTSKGLVLNLVLENQRKRLGKAKRENKISKKAKNN